MRERDCACVWERVCMSVRMYEETEKKRGTQCQLLSHKSGFVCRLLLSQCSVSTVPDTDTYGVGPSPNLPCAQVPQLHDKNRK